MDLDPVLVRPGVEDPAREFGAVVDHDRLGKTALLSQTLEYPRDSQPRQGGVDLDRRAFPGEVVDDRQGPEAARPSTSVSETKSIDQRSFASVAMVSARRAMLVNRRRRRRRTARPLPGTDAAGVDS